MLAARKRSITLLSLGSVAVFCFLLNVSNENGYGYYSEVPSTELSNKQQYVFINEACTNVLLRLSSIGLAGIIIDINFLKGMSNDETDCTVSHLKIAVLDGKEIEYYSPDFDNLTIQVIPYANDINKDYWLFKDKGTRRAISKMPLRNISNFFYPEDHILFKEYWRRSRLLDCLKLNMNRTDSSQRIPIPEGFKQMATLRDLLTSYGMFPFLVSGSLLGWYRECSIIPHTYDIDFAAFVEQFNPQFEIDVLSGKSQFTMKRRLGMLNDSFEYTLYPTNNPKVTIDLFFAYKNENGYWLGGTADNGDKFRYNYPSFDVHCAADLGGYLFWIPCELEALLEADYGQGWRQDHPTSEYKWDKSGKNAKKVGKWPKEKLNEVVVYYQRSFLESLYGWFASRFL